MSADPVLARLVEESARAAARVRDYLVTGEQPDDELISLTDAADLFARSIDSMRRWAKVDGFGIKIDGLWYLRRSMLHRSGKI